MRVFKEDRIQEMLLYRPIITKEWSIVLGPDGTSVTMRRKDYGTMNGTIQKFQTYLHCEQDKKIGEELQMLFKELEKEYYWDNQIKEIINA